MDKKTLYKLTHGMYVLCTDNAGCVVDAVCQISAGDNPLISVAVMKKNYTNEAMHKNDKFTLSIFGLNDDMEIIKNFGFHSQRDFDKFASGMTELKDNIPVVKGTLGYVVLEKVDTIENDTHTLFIGKVVEAETTKEGEAMTYAYYQAHKNDLLNQEKEDLKKVETEAHKTAWVCTVCGYVYYGETLPEGFTCPLCGVGPEMFEKQA